MTSGERHIEIVACPEKETGPDNLRNSEGSIIELADGRLFMVYSNFTAGASDFAVSDIRGKTSDDGGAGGRDARTLCRPVSRDRERRRNRMRSLTGVLSVGVALLMFGCRGVQPSVPAYQCRLVAQAPTIDGVMDEAAWQSAPVLDFLIPESFEEPLSRTEARMLYDESFLYVGFRAWDKDIWAFLEDRDTPTYREDVLEIFLKPDVPEIRYYEIDINPLNAVFDARIAGHVRAGYAHRWKRWNCAGLLSAAKVKGTLGNWEDKDEGWTLEVAVPFEALPDLAGRLPKPGDRWRFHLARYDYSAYLPKGRELTSCAPLTKADFHHIEDWISLVFE